jgi:hypothetical protein
VTDLVVLVPVRGRPHRARPTIEGFKRTAPAARVVFIADPDDTQEQRAIKYAGGELLIHQGGYASKINHGVQVTDEPLVFLAADDLDPQPGWLQAATSTLMQRDVEAVGVNDLIPRRPGRRGHATHFLLTREYAERPTIDDQPGPLSTAYDHSFVDDELIATAKHRRVYAYCDDAHVRHLHPMAGNAPDDETYQRGRRRFRADRALFNERSRLWT